MDTGEKRIYAQLDANSIKLARYLRKQGVGVGEDIAFLSDNIPQVFEVYWADLRSGYYVTGVKLHLTADEAAYILNDRSCGLRGGPGDPDWSELPSRKQLRARQAGLPHATNREIGHPTSPS